jgi:branched-chain amino acid transport system ATP-binding protein
MSVAPSPAHDRSAQPVAELLAVDGVTCQFGGVTAVNAVSFRVARGELFGLIGPNGAGKTTLFNIVTGLTAPSGGHLRYQGEDITGLPPYRVAERGIARTFQNVRLFGELTALDNVMVARHVRTRSGLMSGVLGLGAARREERETRERAASLLALVGLGDRPDESARNLSYGDQRRLEIARALALEPELLLLDEPAAGMNTGEKRALSDLIKSVRARRGLTILLIEHHVPLVMDLCDRIAVLNFGELIALGAPAAVQAHPAVIEAYLGDSV